MRTDYSILAGPDHSGRPGHGCLGTDRVLARMEADDANRTFLHVEEGEDLWRSQRTLEWVEPSQKAL